MEIDLHGYDPSQIVDSGVLDKLMCQAWEMGESKLTLIHGHGRNPGVRPDFASTNIAYFVHCIRRALHQNESLREWICYTTLDCEHIGYTSVKLRQNPFPSRKAIDCWPPPIPSI